MIFGFLFCIAFWFGVEAEIIDNGEALAASCCAMALSLIAMGFARA